MPYHATYTQHAAHGFQAIGGDLKINRAEFFREVTRRVCSSLDIEQALHNAYEYLEGILPVDAVGLLYMDAAQQRMFAVASMVRQGFSFFLAAAQPDEPFPETSSPTWRPSWRTSLW